MTIAVPATKEALADAFVALGSWLSMHTGNPGITGANEATGGGYARKQTTWVADTTDDGVRTGSTVEFDVPAGTYTHVGLWSASSAGAFVDYYDLPSDITMSVAGKIRVPVTFAQP